MKQCCLPVRTLPRVSVQPPLGRLAHFLFLLLLYSLTSCSNGITTPAKNKSTVPLLGTIPDTPFRCLGHSAGYYADPDTGCQVYHMCDTLERQYSYLCPNYTLFNQKFMVCDHWYMVDCATSHTFYHLNSHIGEVHEKNDGEEQQNTITVGPGQDISSKKSKATPSTHTPLSGSALLSARSSSVKSSSSTSKDTRKSQPAFKQSGAQPEKTAIFESFTKPVTPSAKFTITPSTISPPTSSQRKFATSQTRQAITPTSKPVTQPRRLQFTQPTILPRQSSIPSRHSHTSTIRQPFNSTRQSLSLSVRQTATSTRSSFTPQTRQPVIQTTNKPVTPPVRQSTIQPTRQPETQETIQFFTEATTMTPVEVQTPPTSFLTPPKIKFNDHNETQIIENNKKSNVGHSSTHTQARNSFFAVANNLTLSNSTNRHAVEEGKPPAQTEQPLTGLTMMPSSVARSPGNRFSFTSHKDEQPVLTPEELQRIVFQPLLARTHTKTRRILTSAPSLLSIDPANSSDANNHHFSMRIEFPVAAIPEDSSSRDSLDLKLSSRQGVQTPSHILQPPSVSAVLHPLSVFLSPPTHPFTPITGGMKQEFPTPLENYNLRTSPRDTFLPGARRLPFPPSQGNRDFFIPSAELSLLVSELPQNDVEEPAPNPNQRLSDHHHDHHGSHMTMVFPAPIEPSKMEELKLNPECPRCHPQFLKPGQCHPCVVIK